MTNWIEYIRVVFLRGHISIAKNFGTSMYNTDSVRISLFHTLLFQFIKVFEANLNY